MNDDGPRGKKTRRGECGDDSDDGGNLRTTGWRGVADIGSLSIEQGVRESMRKRSEEPVV